jgi:hypothetical protein
MRTSSLDHGAPDLSAHTRWCRLVPRVNPQAQRHHPSKRPDPGSTLGWARLGYLVVMALILALEPSTYSARSAPVSGSSRRAADGTHEAEARTVRVHAPLGVFV